MCVCVCVGGTGGVTRPISCLKPTKGKTIKIESITPGWFFFNELEILTQEGLDTHSTMWSKGKDCDMYVPVLGCADCAHPAPVYQRLLPCVSERVFVPLPT